MRIVLFAVALLMSPGLLAARPASCEQGLKGTSDLNKSGAPARHLELLDLHLALLDVQNLASLRSVDGTAALTAKVGELYPELHFGILPEGRDEQGLFVPAFSGLAEFDRPTPAIYLEVKTEKVVILHELMHFLWGSISFASAKFWACRSGRPGTSFTTRKASWRLPLKN